MPTRDPDWLPPPLTPLLLLLRPGAPGVVVVGGQLGGVGRELEGKGTEPGDGAVATEVGGERGVYTM